MPQGTRPSRLGFVGLSWVFAEALPVAVGETLRRLTGKVTLFAHWRSNSVCTGTEPGGSLHALRHRGDRSRGTPVEEKVFAGPRVCSRSHQRPSCYQFCGQERGSLSGAGDLP